MSSPNTNKIKDSHMFQAQFHEQMNLFYKRLIIFLTTIATNLTWDWFFPYRTP